MNNFSSQATLENKVELPARTERPRRILVVEDEEAIREFIRLALEDEGYEVRTAPDGQYALELLSSAGAAEPGFQPDLILLDMRMPRMDGWTFSQAYNQLNPVTAGEWASKRHAPILVMTAASDAAQFAGQIRSTGYVAKPFDLDELLALVKQFSQPEATSTAL